MNYENWIKNYPMIDVALANDVIHFAEYLIKFQASRVYIYIIHCNHIYILNDNIFMYFINN